VGPIDRSKLILKLRKVNTKIKKIEKFRKSKLNRYTERIVLLSKNLARHRSENNFVVPLK